MRDGMRRSFARHEAEKAHADRERRLAEVAALVDAARRGGIAIERALVEIAETAVGPGRVVRVGEGHTPEVQS